jgi:putative hydrolase of the HAD superfamily
MHLDFIKTQLGNSFYNRFYNCFEKVYYTHEINLRKPDAEIFEFVLKDKNLIANECFFIDDTKENTDIASKLGFKCWNIIPNLEDIIHLKLI